MKYISQTELDQGIEKYKDRELLDILLEKNNENNKKTEKLEISSNKNKTKKSDDNVELEDRLHKLQSLFDKNIISKEEYETQRQKIISEI